MSNSQLSVWTVYDKPKDMPTKFVARRILATAPEPTPTPDVRVADTLDELRLLLPPGLVRLARNEVDEAHIVECWI